MNPAPGPDDPDVSDDGKRCLRLETTWTACLVSGGNLFDAALSMVWILILQITVPVLNAVVFLLLLLDI